MRFTRQTLEVESGALFHFGVVRSESPCAHRLVQTHLRNETLEGDGPIAQRILGATDPSGRDSRDSSIETGGITVVTNIKCSVKSLDLEQTTERS